MDVELAHTVAEEEGSAFWFLGGLEVVKATTATTKGAFSLLYHVGAPGRATPYHVHCYEDEAFYVLEGEATVICGGVKTVVTAGGYIFLPRGVPHGFRVTADRSIKMLILALPGNQFVGMMEEIGVPALTRTLPPTETPADLERLKRSCAEHGIEILGPLPE